MDVPPAAATPGPPATPGWVKLLGIAVLVAVLIFLVLHLTGASPRGH